jgi:hypothetical protein
MTAAKAFGVARTGIHAAWSTAHHEHRDKALRSLEQRAGRNSESFVAALVMNRAETLLEAVDAPADTDALKAAVTSYQDGYKEMDAFYGPALTAGNDTDRFMFKQRAERLLIQSREASRLLAAGTPLAKSGPGSPEQFIAEYNELVDRSNSITWE